MLKLQHRLFVVIWTESQTCGVSQCHDRHMMVLNEWSSRQKDIFFSCTKAAQMEVGTTVSIASCVPLILCAPLTFTDLVVELM